MVDLFRVYISKKRKLKKAELHFADKIVRMMRAVRQCLAVLGQWAFEGLVCNTTDLALNWLGGVTPKRR